MSAFTPGPWRVHPQDVGHKWTRLYVGTQSAATSYFAQVNVPRGYCDPETLANAHLIAAAPELYEALIAMRDCFGEAGTLKEARMAYVKTVDALAKATGAA